MNDRDIEFICNFLMFNFKYFANIYIYIYMDVYVVWMSIARKIIVEKNLQPLFVSSFALNKTILIIKVQIW